MATEIVIRKGTSPLRALEKAKDTILLHSRNLRVIGTIRIVLEEGDE